MGLEAGKDNELVMAILKAAIGEAGIYFRSYSHDHHGNCHGLCGETAIEVEVAGEVTGKLVLTGKAAEQVGRVFGISRQTDDVKRLGKELKAANQRAEALSKKLKQLHALSDPES